MSSPENSFVILSNSPFPSLTSHIEEGSLTDDKTVCPSEIFLAQGMPDVAPKYKLALPVCAISVEEDANEISKSEVNIFGIRSKTSEQLRKSGKSNHTGKINPRTPNKQFNADDYKPGTKSTQCDSMAASFILGEIDVESLKQSICTQLPTMASLINSADDTIKLRNTMMESMVLKDTLAKVNTSIKQYYKQSKIWQNKMRTSEEEHKRKIDNCHLQITLLRNENMDLNKQLSSLQDRMGLEEDMRQKQHNSIVRSISEKAAQIRDMSGQITNLEQNQLEFFENISKDEEDSKNNVHHMTCVGHERSITELKLRLAQMQAERNAVKLDEMYCSKTNQTTAGMLVAKLHADTTTMTLETPAAAIKCDCDKLREEVAILQQQVNVFNKDFAMERSARENLADDKAKLLQDLSTLQRHNQQLMAKVQQKVDEARVRPSFKCYEENRSIRPLPHSTLTETVINNYSCPICNKAFASVALITQHVQSCLKD